MASIISPNICLFCNKSNEFSSAITDKSSLIKQFIELFWRFTESKFTLKVFKIEDLLENEFSNLLNICDECSSVIDLFCNIYYKQKRLEMQLEWKLGIIVDVINLGSKVPSRKNDLVELLNETFYNERSKVSESYNLIETFRESIVQTAQQKLKLSTPRVLLKRMSVNNNGPQHIHVNLMTENGRTLNSNSNADCPGCFMNNDIDTSTHKTDPNVSLDEIDVMRDSQVAIYPNDISVSEDLLPQLNDDDQCSNDEFYTVEDEQGRCSSNNETFGDSVTQIAKQVHLVEDGSGPSQIQDVPPQVYLVSSNNNEIKFSEHLPSILKTEAGPCQHQVCNEIILSNNEQSTHSETNIKSTSSLPSQRYNLRKKCKSKIAKESSSGDESTLSRKFTTLNSTSSESTSESEHDDCRVPLRKISRDYCSSETTSDSENSDFEFKPLKPTGPEDLKVKTEFRKRQVRKIKQGQVVYEEINGLKGFRCPVCKILFQDKYKLKNHFQKSHKRNVKNSAHVSNDDSIFKTECPELDEIFKCHFCQLTFKHAPDLAVHEIQHATQMFTQVKRQVQQNANQKKFQCARCPYKYTVQASYIRHHLTNHLNLLANALPGACTMCSGGKIYISNSKGHYNRAHNKSLLDDQSNTFECDLCPAYFLKPVQLYLHKRKIHQKNIHKCQICDKIFSKKYALQKHLYYVHKYSDEDPKLKFGCDIKDCKKRFNSLGELDHHKTFHRNITVDKERSKGDSTTCEVCGKVCKSKIHLSAHKHTIHSAKSFMCQDCGKAFKTRPKLDAHMLYHQSPDEWKFECAECGKKCVTKHKLEQHMGTHTKEKPWICQFCGEKYAHRHNWRNHLKTKHGDEEGAQEDINGIIAKAQSASFISRKGTKKGDCIINGKSVKV